MLFDLMAVVSPGAELDQRDTASDTTVKPEDLRLQEYPDDLYLLILEGKFQSF